MHEHLTLGCTCPSCSLLERVLKMDCLGRIEEATRAVERPQDQNEVLILEDDEDSLPSQEDDASGFLAFNGA